MRHRKSTVRLNRTASHRKAMFRNMVTSLFREERVQTTVPKAKEASRVAERLITFAKRGDLHARRQAGRVVQDHAVLKKLFDEIGPRFADRPGGYTRILKTGFRAGDNAPMSILELLQEDGGSAVPEAAEEKKKKTTKKGKSKAAKEPKAEKKPEAKEKKSGAKAKPKSKAKSKDKSKSKAKSKTKKKAAK